MSNQSTTESTESNVSDEEIIAAVATEPPQGALFVTLDEDGDVVLTSEEPQ